MPRLSIVIPSYSRVDCLAACLRSVRQFAPPETEVLVVDDASPNAIIAQAAESFAGVQVHRLPRRSGFCVAANRGIRTATAPIVELLNDDTEVSAGWADAALDRFADPRIAAVAPLVHQLDPVRSATGLPMLIDSAGDDYDSGGFACKRGHGLPVGSDPVRFGQAQPVCAASASAAFYRRDLVLKLGGFPEHFGAYFEDVDLSLRLREAGFAIWFEPNSRVGHRVSASYGRRPGRRLLEQQSCNEERLFWRNLPTANGWRTLPRHAAVLAGKAIRRWQEGTLLPWSLGRFRAWCGG